MSASNWEMALSLSRKLLSAEDQEKVPKDFYTAKKMINVLGLGYKKIDVCINDCFLYYDEQSKNLNACLVCGESRYELRNMAVVRQKAVPRRSLWYLSITPRLQRLHMFRKMAEHMTWHLKCNDDSDEVIHPVGSQAWKHFEETYPTFAAEPRNVRLGLCIDGFNPFGPSASAYSCWPVFLTVYNLSPELCMNLKRIFLSMIIVGPKSPGKNIDVLLRPLIDELNQLWTNGVETYDSFRKQNFIMKAALLWIVSDFLGYGMLSGWSTHGSFKTQCYICSYSRPTSSCLSVAEGFEIPKWRLLPIAFRDLLIDAVWGPLTDVSNFFIALCALIIQVSNMEMWEEKIVETICKLEKAFPPTFLDSMEQLAIHLPYEAKVGGLVQFRWMYPFERKGWYAACKIRARAIIDTSSLSNCVNNYYQDDDPPMPQLVQPSTIVDDHVPLASSGEERVVISEDLQLSYSTE
ncbi:hypothetical protein SLEP1_g40882 [Rubroshorea leprosula]|uniref:DUF4218 domain-containing protein n=1 Tax=Rubroshorea leprosula TaxID=152421 RepID=A0AAV5L5E1_9ROSI|nr:hypothetical protein SLEP1_g40882 [Rubroshorea leprosula]